MEWKDYIEKGSLAIVATGAALYLSGMEYYLSLFHGIGTGVFFVVPVEYAVYEGLAPVRGVLVISVFCAMLGYLVRSEFAVIRIRDRILTIGRWRYTLVIMISVLVAWFMPIVAAWTLDVPKISIQISGANWELFCWGLPTCLVALWLFAAPPKLSVMRRFLSFWLILLLILWSYVYSSLIGESFASQISSKQKAVVTFSDEAIQKEYAGSLFHPVMEKGDELILLKFGPGGETPPKVIFVKRALVKKIELR